jgi:hypothetical protein
MFAYLIRRLLAVVPVMAVVVTVVFLLIHLIPGDPVSVMLGPDATPTQIDATRRALGLDRPIYQQLLGFYGRVLRGDLGQSYFLDRPVVTAIVERAEPTLMLMICALLVDRPVESERAPCRLDLGGRRVGPQHHADRVARDEVDEQEHHRHHHRHHRDDGQQASDQVREHERRSGLARSYLSSHTL